MIHITKYLVSIKLHFVCFLIGFLLFMNIFYFYYSSNKTKLPEHFICPISIGQSKRTR